MFYFKGKTGYEISLLMKKKKGFQGIGWYWTENGNGEATMKRAAIDARASWKE